MFSYDERIKAVNLLIQYDMSYSTVVRELGYPERSTLKEWYKEYVKSGDVHKKFEKKDKFSNEERKRAVNYYLEHGKCVSRTVKILGYPSRPTLNKWIKKMLPEEKASCYSRNSRVKCTQEQKEKAVISLCSRNKTAKEIADDIGVTREVLYNWKRQLLSKGSEQSMSKKGNSLNKSIENKKDISNTDLLNKKKSLEKQVKDLQQEVDRLRLEREILDVAADVIKKDQGINLKTLSNREKTIVINALRDKAQLKDFLEILNIAKSSYCYQVIALKKNDKYSNLREKIRITFEESSKSYGYRRIHSEIRSSNITISEKVIRRIMKEEKLVVPYIKRKKYNSYKGEITPAVENIIKRNFHADKPNEKWLTDITEFSIPAGKIYLSPIIDCFDGLPVTWTIGTSPNAELVNTMLDEAISVLNEEEHPIVHSDRGCHYRWPGWIERMNGANLIRSMSKKGCSPDNSACEGFFGRLKNEMFYGRSWIGITIEEFIAKLDKYIKWYSEKRIKLSLGGMSPLEYRKSLGLTF